MRHVDRRNAWTEIIIRDHELRQTLQLVNLILHAAYRGVVRAVICHLLRVDAVLERLIAVDFRIELFRDCGKGCRAGIADDVHLDIRFFKRVFKRACALVADDVHLDIRFFERGDKTVVRTVAVRVDFILDAVDLVFEIGVDFDEFLVGILLGFENCDLAVA